jgi:HKD family nuclease
VHLLHHHILGRIVALADAFRQLQALQPGTDPSKTSRMQAQMIFQPFEADLSLYAVLEQGLTDDRFDEFTAVVAWAKKSGLSRIRPLIQGFRARGGTARILLGIDEGGASVEGLYAAIGDFDEKFVLNDAGSGTFHPKLYIFSGETVSIVITGSSNLTRGGLFANYEVGVCPELDLTQDSDAQVREAVTSYVQRLWQDGTSKPLTEDLIQKLIDDPRYDIPPEASHPGGASAPGSPDGAPLLFGISQHAKNQDPAPVSAATTGLPVGSLDINGTSNSESPHLDASKADRVEKFGEIAYRHKEFIEMHGSMTQADSLAIRRQMYGPGQKGVQRTVTLFGREGSHSILWMQHQEDGKTRAKDLVWLTDEGSHIAELWHARQVAASTSS